MRYLVLVCGLMFSLSTFAEDPADAADTAELHDVVLLYYTTQHELGGQHPKIVKLRTQVELRLKAGEQLITSKLDAKLSELYREHLLLTEKLSIRHPRTQANLRKLAITAKLMEYDSECFAKNWDRLTIDYRPVRVVWSNVETDQSVAIDYLRPARIRQLPMWKLPPAVQQDVRQHAATIGDSLDPEI